MKLELGIVLSRLKAYIFRELDVTKRAFLTYRMLIDTAMDRPEDIYVQ